MGNRWDEEGVRAAVADARSLSEALRKLGIQSHGANHRTLRSQIERWGISTAHFDPMWAQRAERLRSGPTPIEDVLIEGSSFHRGHLKARLFSEGLKDRACEECGQGELWRGRRMALILDHVNGVPNDHRLENLRILCPNCAATLDTHCGRKNAVRLAPRNCKSCDCEFKPKNDRQRYCSRRCSGIAQAKRLHGKAQPHLRKVQRPDVDRLLAEIESDGYLATGRRYGVSDNAIRKWVRQYERELSAWAAAGCPGPEADPV